MVDKVQRRLDHPIWELDQFDTPVKKKTVELPFSWDTMLTDARKAFHAGIIESPEASNAHHKLEAPQFDATSFKMVKEEMGALIPQVEKNEDTEAANKNPHLNDTLLFLLYIACLKAQQDSREEGNLLAMKNAQQRQEVNRHLQEEYFNTLDEKIARSEADEVLGWVSWALWGAIAVAGVVSIALTIATGMAALPVVLAVANGALAVSQGGVQITQGVFKYQDGLATGDMIENEAERYVNTTRTREELELMKHSMQVIAEAWKAMIEVLNNQYQASTNK